MSELSTEQFDQEKYFSITHWLRLAPGGNDPPVFRAESSALVLEQWPRGAGSKGRSECAGGKGLSV